MTRPSQAGRRDRRSRHRSGRIAAISHVGLVRERNEDDFHASDDGRLLVVADGLGGLPGGDVASRVAVEKLAALYEEARDGEVWDVEGAKAFLVDAFMAAHDEIRTLSRGRRVGGYMATTLVASVTAGESLLVCHVGDVRGYTHSMARFEQVTRDHSLVGDLMAAGALTSEEARRHPQRHLVTRALGLPDDLEPSCVCVPLCSGDVVVLCSDGLWESMTHEEMARIVGDKSTAVHERADALLARALAAGGTDNITVILYEHVAESERPGRGAAEGSAER